MEWHGDDDLGDHLDDHDGSHYEQAGGDLADIADFDIESGKDIGIDLAVSERSFADLEIEDATDTELDLDSIEDGTVASGAPVTGDEPGAQDHESQNPSVGDLGGFTVLDENIAAQIEGSLNTNELMTLVEEAREFYAVRLVEVNGRIKPFGDYEDVQLWLRHVRQGRRHWSKDRRTTFSPMRNSREYQIKVMRDAAEKAERDRERYLRKKFEGTLPRKSAAEKELAQKCHEHCLRKVRAARKTPAFRECMDEDDVKVFEARVYDEAQVAYMSKHLAKGLDAAHKEERKARARGIKSIMLQRGVGKSYANRLWNEMEERVEELLVIVAKGPDAYNTKKEIEEAQQEIAETMAAMREHQQS